MAVARYRVGLAYFTDRTQHATKAKRFGEKLCSAQQAIDALLAMRGIPEDLRLRAGDLTQRIREELAEHEKLRRKD